jgi:hypothetical protein
MNRRARRAERRADGKNWLVAPSPSGHGVLPECQVSSGKALVLALIARSGRAWSGHRARSHRGRGAMRADVERVQGARTVGGTFEAPRTGVLRHGRAVVDPGAQAVQAGLVLTAAMARQGGAIDVARYSVFARRRLGTLRFAVKQVAAVTLEAMSATGGAASRGAARTRCQRGSDLLWASLLGCGSSRRQALRLCGRAVLSRHDADRASRAHRIGGPLYLVSREAAGRDHRRGRVSVFHAGLRR